jgi:hypothetical protein
MQCCGNLVANTKEQKIEISQALRECICAIEMSPEYANQVQIWSLNSGTCNKPVFKPLDSPE